MKRMFHSMVIALSMYSVLPMPMVDWDKENMRYVMCFFPLVGAVVGGAVYGWLWLCALLGIGPALAAAVAAALPVAISGGIHLDGFCDTIDALASHAPMERKLEILKDSHIGAFALIGCCLYFLLSFGLWSEFSAAPANAGIVAVGYVLSRSLSGLSVVTLRCAKSSGLAAAFSDGAAKKRAAAALAATLALCAGAMLALSPVVGGGCLAAAAAVFFGYRRMAYRQFGGITGDLAGYFLQLCEAAILAAAVVLGGVAV